MLLHIDPASYLPGFEALCYSCEIERNKIDFTVNDQSLVNKCWITESVSQGDC